MDIHKPKPWHGLREFLKEYVIIVVGVLTALGGEQVVEQLHNRAEAAETREALHAEIAGNAMHAKVTIAENVCSDALRDKTIAWLNGGPRPGVGNGRAMMLPLNSTVWDTAYAKGVAHMPMEEQLRLASYYGEVRLYNENEASRRQEGRLAAAILMVDHVTPEQLSRLAEYSNGSALLRGYQTGNAQRAIDFAVAMKIKPVPVNPGMRPQLEAYCRQAGVAVPPL